MKPTKKYTFTIGAFGVYRLQVAGDYFKLLQASGAVKVVGQFGELSGLITGQGLENSDFLDLFFTDESGASNTITVVVGDRNFIDGVTGAVQITDNVPIRATLGNTAVTVTSASTMIDAANATRKFLLIQNKSTSGTIYLNFGAAATVANGLKIGPGGSFESAQVCPVNAVYAIGDIGSNPDVVIVEG